MTTYRELCYMVLDELKLMSDDNYFNEEHCMFLLKHYRNMLLKQRYSDIRKKIPDSNKQTLCINLEIYQPDECSELQLRSIEKLPDTLGIYNITVTTYDESSTISFVSREQFKYSGTNKYTKNLLYATRGGDGKLYIKSNNPQFKYLKKVKVIGVFEDVDIANELSCCKSDEQECDIMESSFPIESALINTLIQTVVKELSGSLYIGKDESNDAADDTNSINTYIKQNMKKNWNIISTQ